MSDLGVPGRLAQVSHVQTWGRGTSNRIGEMGLFLYGLGVTPGTLDSPTRDVEGPLTRLGPK